MCAQETKPAFAKSIGSFLEPAAAQWADTDRMRHDFSACLFILSSWPLLHSPGILGTMGRMDRHPQTRLVPPFPKAMTSCDRGPLTDLGILVSHSSQTDNISYASFLSPSLSSQVQGAWISLPSGIAILNQDSFWFFIITF